ncbi:fumarylacetoacetate hydrolase family protein [Thioalkalivibrio thiocyanodenitrificans]|uniref:fumarylacetoacetate hydrolase family protein n=1 Tax=Thioalkalivibrio thiocyanodenitrificans TaxID=243063 RepID=UPI00037F5B83|nr:fumarylacetoacetate hydrolase family protein [Thioalkalivibrio thiocyanodenitrificans]
MANVLLEDGTPVPVHTIFCIGHNYAAHARERGTPVPESPAVFIKPDTTLVVDGGPVRLPRLSTDVHHEVEMVALLGDGVLARAGREIPEAEALACVRGYGVGIDVTARDFQQRARERGLPWAVGKGFDTFAPVSRFVDAARVADPQALRLWLDVNGERRQDDLTRGMTFGLASVIHYLSTIFTLTPGDLIFTGTPGGVARFEHGDRIEAGLGPDGAPPLCTLAVGALREPVLS